MVGDMVGIVEIVINSLMLMNCIVKMVGNNNGKIEVEIQHHRTKFVGTGNGIRSALADVIWRMVIDHHKQFSSQDIKMLYDLRAALNG